MAADNYMKEESHMVILSLTSVKRQWRAFQMTKRAKKHHIHTLRKDRSPRSPTWWVALLVGWSYFNMKMG